MFRVSAENDIHYRTKIQRFINAPINPSPVDIQNTFESLVGLRPVIQEDFETRVLNAGESVPPNEVLATFSIQFNIEITKVFETVIVNADNITVDLGYKSIDDFPTIHIGTDGVTTTGGGTDFTSASATFLDGRLVVGDKIIVEDGADPRTYIIDSITDNNIVEVTPNPSNAESSLTWHSEISDTYNAYLYKDDRSHQNDISVSMDSEARTITLNDDYAPGTKIDVEYYITPLEDYDTIEELIANEDFFNILIKLTKAAGVTTNPISFVKFMASWFQDTKDVLTIRDDVEFGGSKDVKLWFIFGMIEPAPAIITGWHSTQGLGANWGDANWGTPGFPNTSWVEDIFRALTAVTGAVAYDGGSPTTETTAAQNNTIDDMILLPVTPAVNDAYYLGHDNIFNGLQLQISQNGDGVWDFAYEYSQGGASWGNLTNVIDRTNEFSNSGNILFKVPDDWATDTVNGITNKYWIRIRVSAYTSVTTQPLGQRADVYI